MSQEPKRLYETADDLPLNPIESGTSLLVTGPAIGGTQRVAMRLLEGGGNEGLLFVTIDRTGREIIDLFEDCGGRYTKNRMAVVDCSEGGRESVPLNIRTVSSPADLTGIGIVYSSLYEQLYGSNILQVRTSVYNLSSLLAYVDDFTSVFRFLNTTTGRIRSAGGLGIFVLDPDAQDQQTNHTLARAFDGRVEVRESGDGYELRVRGLENQPEEWQRFTLPEREK